VFGAPFRRVETTRERFHTRATTGRPRNPLIPP
jgi:hypothetical protein